MDRLYYTGELQETQDLFCRKASPSTMTYQFLIRLRVMPIINSHACAAADMLVFILYLMKQIKRKMFQKPKEMTKGSIPYAGET